MNNQYIYWALIVVLIATLIHGEIFWKRIADSLSKSFDSLYKKFLELKKLDDDLIADYNRLINEYKLEIKYNDALVELLMEDNKSSCDWCQRTIPERDKPKN